MQRLFDPVNDALRDFVRQRDDLALVVRVTDVETAYVLKMLSALDEAVLPDIFWMFAQDFDTPQSYVDAVLAAFLEKFEAARKAMKDKPDMPAWPAAPPALADARREPVARMRELMLFARSLIPSLESANLVWVLFPIRVNSPVEWARFAAELLRHEVPVAWCHHMRVILRDATASPSLGQHLRSARRVQWLSPDMSPAAMEKAIEEDAADPALPVPQRMQSLLQLAMLDYSHRRYVESAEKYALLIEYYTAMKDHTMLSLSLNGMGEVADRAGDPKRAQHYLESALIPAIGGKVYAVLLNITLNLGNLHLGQQHWQQAEEYYVAGADLSKAMRNPYVLIRCIENVGACRYGLKDHRAAWEKWTEAATLAKNLEEHALLKEVLERLRVLYRDANMRREYADVDREIARLEALVPKAN